MKLNNKGFGLKEMLIMSGILFLFLFIAAYYISSLYNGMSDSVYLTLKVKLESAAIKYNPNNDNKIITLNELINNGVITNFDDDNGNKCNGYVIFNNRNYEGYISCKDYVSPGYEKFLEN